MGSNKAELMVKGEPAALRTARELAPHCERVTILGRTPLPPYPFLEDVEEFAGPLSALTRFVPTADCVFLASCDMPRFDGQLVPFFHSLIGDSHSVVPVISESKQPLCALYSAAAWDCLPQLLSRGRRSMMSWLETLTCRFVTGEDIQAIGIDPLSLQGANTPDEWEQLVPE